MSEVRELSEAEAVRVEAFGFDKPEPYVVHVYGPDDVEGFDSWLDAVQFANDWNTATVEYVNRRFAEEGGMPPLLTKSWATPYTREAALELGVIR